MQNSEFDNNQDGFDTNSQNNDDAPSPQDGGCPNGSTNSNPPPGTQRKTSCWVFTHNYVHDNNNPNVPSAGSAAAGPAGTGMSIAGGRHDIVTANRFSNNGAWGILLVPYPDTETPPDVAHCEGGVGQNGTAACYFDDFANEIAGNTFSNNGFFGNATNGDIGELSNPNPDGNCVHDNMRADGSAITSDPPAIESTHGTCGKPGSGNQLASPFGVQVACDSQLLFPCPANAAANYPRVTHIKLAPLPSETTMPDPCAGVPANAFCSSSARAVHHSKEEGQEAPCNTSATTTPGPTAITTRSDRVRDLPARGRAL